MPDLSECCFCADIWAVRGPYHFQGHNFPQDQILGLDTLGWWVTDFESNPISDDELGRHLGKTLMASLEKQDREYVFTEDLLDE